MGRPGSVTFIGQQNPACLLDAMGREAVTAPGCP
jgi:hypothetical protein